MQRNTKIIVSVLVFHVLLLWAMHSGLLRKVKELIVPPEIIVELAAPEEPEQPKVQPKIEKQVVPTPQPKQVVTPEPIPLAVADNDPSPSQQVYVPPAPPPPSPPTTTSTVAKAPPPAMVLPSTDADYLKNPAPIYPSLSKKLNEQGRVMVHVLVGTDGSAQKVELQRGSGFDRLDQSALTAVSQWRFGPGKRAGVIEAMWYAVPIDFQLTK